ncbi:MULTISPECIES: hypothetical protein [unclassified Dysgonomonas]|nr:MULTISPECIES: hypothetical protein [unclassified Dysgonomonas]HMM03030.1 hypothetical protein [Dysgonomonas sp.]
MKKLIILPLSLLFVISHSGAQDMTLYPVGVRKLINAYPSTDWNC